MKVLILSGIPGSGKSRYAESVIKARVGFVVEVFSADHFFTKEGVYRFDKTKLGEAHGQCLRNYLYAITSTRPHTVVVDNTNVREIDIVRYADPALALGHDLEIVTFVCPAALGAERNQHRVPLYACERMAETLAGRRLPPQLKKFEHVIGVKD